MCLGLSMKGLHFGVPLICPTRGLGLLLSMALIVELKANGLRVAAWFGLECESGRSMLLHGR